MKVALVHDQLQEFGGAERVLVALKSIFPEADVYTSFFNRESLGIHATHFEGWNIISSWAGRVPLLKKIYSPLRFITPLIWESFDFSAYDLVISSSGSYMCKGIITRPETVHLCYLHHQPRYLYYYETAMEWQKHWPIRAYGNLINHDLRIWDYLSSQRVDEFIANSEETKKRIEKFYRRDAQVVYPPVSIPESLSLSSKNKSNSTYYLIVSRLARAKHIDVAVQAANFFGFQLKIVGRGRDEKYLRSIAGPTVEFLGSVRDNDFDDLYRGARAFLFTSVDDEFGIAPVEALGRGVPVIGFASGGVKETIQDGENGYLFDALNRTELGAKVKQLESLSNEKYQKMCATARKSAEQYVFDEFKKGILKIVHARTS
jgi:glycosyltransferase involved in cell wall biosynthesis